MIPPSLLTLFYLFASLLRVYSHSDSAGFCAHHLPMAATTLGGHRDSNADLDSLARFAVDHHNTKENALLQLVRVLKAEEQVVAGTLHHLTLEILDAGKKKIYEAKIWVKPWMDFKEVQEFKHVGDAEDAPSFTNSDLGAKKESERCSGWQSVAVHDPLVKDAADHAVKTIQGRSNSLVPYELTEVVDAIAEIVGDSAANINLVLKLKRGEKEEKMKVLVHKNVEGNYHLNHMEPHK